MSNYRQLFHNYFYQGPGVRSEFSGCNYHFSGNRFYSYYTVIGLTLPARDRGLVFCESFWSMTSTTCKHIYDLRRAAPFNSDRIIDVPFRYGENPSTAGDVRALFMRYFNGFSASMLKYTDSRRELLRVYNEFRRFVDLCGGRAVPVSVVKLAGLAADGEKQLRDRQAAIAARSPEQVAAAAAKRAAAAARKAAKFAAMIADLQRLPYLDKVKLAFSRGGEVDEKRRAALRNELTNYNYYSLVWVAGDRVKTSRGVTLPLALVRGLLRRWLAGDVAVGMHCGPYEVRAFRADAVQIGCHCIPLENLRALASALLPSDDNGAAVASAD